MKKLITILCFSTSFANAQNAQLPPVNSADKGLCFGYDWQDCFNETGNNSEFSSLDISELPNGIYNLSISQNNLTENFMITKQPE